MQTSCTTPPCVHRVAGKGRAPGEKWKIRGKCISAPQFSAIQVSILGSAAFPMRGRRRLSASSDSPDKSRGSSIHRRERKASDRSRTRISSPAAAAQSAICFPSPWGLCQQAKLRGELRGSGSCTHKNLMFSNVQRELCTHLSSI